MTDRNPVEFAAFADRKRAALQATGVRPGYGTDRGSLFRLSALPEDAWSPADFQGAAREIVTSRRFRGEVYRPGQVLPPFEPGVRFKWPEYEDLAGTAVDERLRIAVALEGQRVVGYATAEWEEGLWEVRLVDVDVYSRRYAGVSVGVKLGEEVFGVGLGHGLVDLLMQELGAPLTVDATTDESRYLFRSLGFTRTSSPNPCLYELKLVASPATE